MKKTFFIFLVILSTLFFPKAIFAITVSVSDASGTPGQKNIAVSIDVRGLNPKQKISGIDLWLDYNANDLEIVQVKNGRLTATWNILYLASEPGKLKIGLYSADILRGAKGSIAVVVFNVKDMARAGQASLLRLEKATFNEKPATAKKDGTLKVLKNKKSSPSRK